MSLYYVQKLLYQLNRDPQVQQRYEAAPDDLLAGYDLTSEETAAIKTPDIGLLYVLGVNGQILMHFAAYHRIAWPDYIEALRQGIKRYGDVRDGIYRITGYEGLEAHEAALRTRRQATASQPKEN